MTKGIGAVGGCAIVRRQLLVIRRSPPTAGRQVSMGWGASILGRALAQEGKRCGLAEAVLAVQELFPQWSQIGRPRFRDWLCF